MRVRRTVREGSRRDDGYTLLEMLIVLVVIGMIAAVAIPQVLKLLGSAKTKVARIQLQTLSNSLLYYQTDVGKYPTTEQGLAALWTAPAGITGWDGPYVRRQKQLIDPWGNPMVYRAPGKEGPYDLITLGADGRVGGSGENADISAAD